jgi:hypothetical protein
VTGIKVTGIVEIPERVLQDEEAMGSILDWV